MQLPGQCFSSLPTLRSRRARAHTVPSPTPESLIPWLPAGGLRSCILHTFPGDAAAGVGSPRREPVALEQKIKVRRGQSAPAGSLMRRGPRDGCHGSPGRQCCSKGASEAGAERTDETQVEEGPSELAALTVGRPVVCTCLQAPSLPAQ